MLLGTETKGKRLSVGSSRPFLVVECKSSQRRSLGLVFCCTLLGAAAQVLMKSGAGHVSHPGLAGVLVGMFTDPWLFSGYALYGVSTLLLILALRDGQLSLLYPVIALTYVWVTLASLVFFREAINPYKLTGIAIIIMGVAVLGRSSQQ